LCFKKEEDIVKRFDSGKVAAGFILLFVFILPVSFAGTVGNLVNFPEAQKFSVGLEIIKIDNRDVYEHDDKVSRVMQDTERTLGKISYGLLSGLSLDLWYGKADYSYGPEENYKNESLVYDTGKIWGLGIRTKFFEDEENGLSAGAGFRYYRSSPEDYYRRESRMYFSAKPEEWDLSFDLVKELGEYVNLYGVLRYSELDIPFTHPATGNKTRIGGYKSENNVGGSIGVELKLLEKISLCLERRFVDEESSIFSAGYKW